MQKGAGAMRCELWLVMSWLVLLLSLPTAAPQDLPEIRARGVLRLLVSADEKPEAFSFTPGTAPGFEREIAEGFARLHRLELGIIPVNHFEEIIPMLIEGRGDLVTGLIATKERQKIIDFTVELMPTRHLVVSRAPTPTVVTVEQLRQQTVGIIPGNAWAKAVAEAGVPLPRTVRFADINRLLEGLREGRISATVTSLATFILAKKRDPELQAGMFLGERLSHAWGVRKEGTALRQALDEYLSLTRKSGSWSRLIVKYYGADALAVLDRAGGVDRGPDARRLP